MNKTTKSILKYVIEFLIVGFGVFLGIYVNELQSADKMEMKKEKALRYMLEELESNKQKLKTASVYHQSIKSSMDSISQVLTIQDLSAYYLKNKKFNHNQIPGWTGFRQASLEYTAFESAKLSGVIAEYDMETLQLISKIYNLQQTYSEFGKSIFNKMINIDSSAKVADAVGVIEIMTYDLLNFEKGLVKEIETVEKQLIP